MKCAHTVSKVTVKCQLWYVASALECTEQPYPSKSHSLYPFRLHIIAALSKQKSNTSIVSRTRGRGDTINWWGRFFSLADGKNNKPSVITWDDSPRPTRLCTCTRGFERQVCGIQPFREEKKGKCWTLLMNSRVWVIIIFVFCSCKDIKHVMEPPPPHWRIPMHRCRGTCDECHSSHC